MKMLLMTVIHASTHSVKVNYVLRNPWCFSCFLSPFFSLAPNVLCRSCFKMKKAEEPHLSLQLTSVGSTIGCSSCDNAGSQACRCHLCLWIPGEKCFVLGDIMEYTLRTDAPPPVILMCKDLVLQEENSET